MSSFDKINNSSIVNTLNTSKRRRRNIFHEYSTNPYIPAAITSRYNARPGDRNFYTEHFTFADTAPNKDSPK